MWEPLRLLFSNVSASARRGESHATKLSPGADVGAQAAQVTVVGLVADHNDRRLLANLSFDNGWIMHFVDSSAEAQAASARLRVPVILYDRDLPSADWRDIVSLLASSSRPTCVILISRVADDHLWEEVIRRGGYEVLSKPLRPEEVVRMIKLAWSFWNSMMKMPAYAGKRSASNSP
jgi:DNA-binding NtrC family response regulator